jgi:carbamoyl-phosphate synthase large subunit
LPTGGVLFVSVKDSDKPRILGAVQQLAAWGWQVIATGGTADYLEAQGVAVERVNKVAQGRPHIVDRIKDGDVQLIFNTTEGWQSLQDSQSIRASALAADIAYYTTAAASHAATEAIGALRARSLEVKPLQDYY